MEAVSDKLYELLMQIEKKKQFRHNSEKKQKTSKKIKKCLTNARMSAKLNRLSASRFERTNAEK